MPLTNSAKYVFGQPCRVLVGDPTIADGAGLTDLSTVQRVEIQAQFGRQVVSNEGNQLLSDGATGWVKGAQITMTLFSAQGSKIAALMPEVSASTEALTFRNSVAAINPPTLIIVPESEVGDDTSDFIWFVPAAVITQDPGAFIFKLEETMTSGEPFQVTMNAMVRLKDQDDNDLPDGKQIIFRGSMPAEWSLPAPYDGSSS